jgi:adenosylhomocysteine nucleosidase
MRIGIIAALPGELKPLVRGWKRNRSVPSGIMLWKADHNGDQLIAVCGGMGAAAATRSFSAAESEGPLDLVLSIGWAGALDSGMRTGECYIPSEIIDAQTGEGYSLTDSKRTQRLVTTPAVADITEKRRLWQSYGAAMVDMEAATIARLARMRDIPICCFKGISDGTDATLPDLNRFIDDHGKMRMISFIAHVALRPGYWKHLVRLGRHSSKAAQAIATKVEKFLDNKDVQRTNRTGAV